MDPKRRQDNLIVREMDDEVLIYDRTANRAVCLNRAAWTVWNHCDGRTSVDQMRTRLSTEMASSLPEGLVERALKDLGAAGLLEPGSPIAAPGLTRRQLGARMAGTLGAALIPSVIVLGAPTPAQAAASCREAGKQCTDNAQCCSKCCCTKSKGNLFCT